MLAFSSEDVGESATPVQVGRGGDSFPQIGRAWKACARFRLRLAGRQRRVWSGGGCQVQFSRSGLHRAEAHPRHIVRDNEKTFRNDLGWSY
jgi:hypothetical protein